jgi:hypothetical protein
MENLINFTLSGSFITALVGLLIIAPIMYGDLPPKFTMIYSIVEIILFTIGVLVLCISEEVIKIESLQNLLNYEHRSIEGNFYKAVREEFDVYYVSNEKLDNNKIQVMYMKNSEVDTFTFTSCVLSVKSGIILHQACIRKLYNYLKAQQNN